MFRADSIRVSQKIQDGFSPDTHAIKVPVGYGFGCSAAVALSLSMALNAALGSPLTKKEEAGIAHKVEICRTGTNFIRCFRQHKSVWWQLEIAKAQLETKAWNLHACIKTHYRADENIF